MKKRVVAAIISGMLAVSMLMGCKGSSKKEAVKETTDEKVFVYGTTGYGVEMGDEGLNPHSNYSGWSCVRYGVGETLFKFSDSMEPQPWLATSYTFTDENTVEITLRDDVTFTSGRKMDAEAVKECLEHLLSVHDRAPSDLKIDKITAKGQKVIIHTSKPCPVLINYLCDPYGAIIDMRYGIKKDMNVAGTGPYKAVEVSDKQITLVKNDNYWDGVPKVDKVIIKSIMDGDTLTMALQSGEVNAAYGLPYASYPLFEGNEAYSISSTAGSRVFFSQMNFQSELMQDDAVRAAIAMGIDKEGFVKTLLDNNGVVAKGAFPDSFSFGNKTVQAKKYDPEEAKKVLREDGWTDKDGDGYVEKDGKKLTIRWLTYPGRQELPLLAESAQATLKDIGIKVDINCTADYMSVLDAGDYDVYASALVTAPTGDPEYFFTTCTLDDSSKNKGHYHSDELESLEKELHASFDTKKRAELATKMQQILLDDDGYVFASHLKMSIVSQASVKGLTAHPCDYYEITKDLGME